MTNREATRNLCTAVASLFYPDRNSVGIVLLNRGVEPDGEYSPNDPEVMKAVIFLVLGFVESSRSEGGVSASLRSETAIRRSLALWCRQCGLDPDKELQGFGTSIRNVSGYW